MYLAPIWAAVLVCWCLPVLAGTGEVTAVSTHWGIHEDVYCAVSNAAGSIHHQYTINTQAIHKQYTSNSQALQHMLPGSSMAVQSTC
jgi:hypothetical protein